MSVTQAEAVDFLRRFPVITVSALLDGRPMSTVVLTAINDDFTMHFACSRTSFKAKALFSDCRMSFSVWNNHEFLVQADGCAKEVTNKDLIDSILDQLTTASLNLEDFWPPVLSIDKKEYVIFEIQPKWFRVLDLRNLRINEKELPFTLFTPDYA